MDCPSCASPMQIESFGAIQVDVCLSGCRGIWFDEGELQRVDHTKKGIGPGLERALRAPEGPPRSRELIDCPKCSQPMDQVEYEFNSSVTIDSCEGCAGSFLDAGELARLRDRRMTDGESGSMRLRRRRIRRMRQRRRQGGNANAMVAVMIMNL